MARRARAPAAGCSFAQLALLSIHRVEELLIGTDALLSPAATPALRRCLTQRCDVYVSAASFVSLGRKCGRERCRYSTTLARWMQNLLDRYPQSILPIDGETAWLTGELLSRYGGSARVAQEAASALLHDLTVISLCPSRYARLGCRTVGRDRPV